MEFDDEQPRVNGPSSSPSAARVPNMGGLGLETSLDCQIDEPMLLLEFWDSALDQDNLMGINSCIDVP